MAPQAPTPTNGPVTTEITDISAKTLKSQLGDTAETSIDVDVGFQTPARSDAEPDSLPLGASASDINRNTLSVLGVGPDNITQLQSVHSSPRTLDFGPIRPQLLHEREHQLRTAQDSSVFMPVPSQSGEYIGVPAQTRLAAPRLPSLEKSPMRGLKRPFSPGLSDISDTEAEFNQLPPTPADAAAAVSRQHSIVSHTSRTSRISRHTQRSHHSDHSSAASVADVLNLAHKLADNLTMVVKEQREEAAERERVLLQENAERERAILKEAAERERMAAEREQAVRQENLEREKLQLQQTADLAREAAAREALQAQQAANREQALRLELSNTCTQRC